MRGVQGEKGGAAGRRDRVGKDGNIYETGGGGDGRRSERTLPRAGDCTEQAAGTTPGKGVRRKADGLPLPRNAGQERQGRLIGGGKAGREILHSPGHTERPLPAASRTRADHHRRRTRQFLQTGLPCSALQRKRCGGNDGQHTGRLPDNGQRNPLAGIHIQLQDRTLQKSRA